MIFLVVWRSGQQCAALYPTRTLCNAEGLFEKKDARSLRGTYDHRPLSRFLFLSRSLPYRLHKPVTQSDQAGPDTCQAVRII